MNISFSNSTSDFCIQGAPDSLTVRNAKSIFLYIVGGFAVFGNIFVIKAALKCSIRRRLHYLIINMAVADTLFVLTTLFYVLRKDFNIFMNIPESFAEALCKTMPFLNDVSFSASASALFIISIDRFRATIVRKIRAQKRGTITVLVLSWLIPSICVAYGPRSKVLNGECLFLSDFHHYIISVVLILILVIQSFVILFLSIVTLKRLSKSSGIEGSLSEPQRTTRARRMKKIVHMVICSLVLFSCNYFPVFIMALLILLSKLGYSICVDTSTMIFLFALFPVLNSSLSPYIYCVFLTDIRDSAKNLIVLRRLNICRIFKRKSVELKVVERQNKVQVTENN
ncbi:allatostatin-A receptor-like [Exaiptasia diaphana]|uniref:G-protein coupled receptors family 1 profile domain-containing protein n=1 Tax=Exaiptasia diaphana TaxID=2652724 RepID=A0A913YIN0_EXADI|nr:allatostatin-A receptor-like [Exaiptasia diaphana]